MSTPPIHVPLVHRAVLGATTAWILVPLTYASAFDTIFMALAGVPSVLHWSLYRHHSWRHRLDLACATGLLSWVAYCSFSLEVAALFLAMLVFLYRGRQHMARHEYLPHLLYHLVFRYLAFWVLCVHVRLRLRVVDVAMLTAAYVGHALVLYAVYARFVGDDGSVV